MIWPKTRPTEVNTSQHDPTLNHGRQTNEWNQCYQFTTQPYISTFTSMSFGCGYSIPFLTTTTIYYNLRNRIMWPFPITAIENAPMEIISQHIFFSLNEDNVGEEQQTFQQESFHNSNILHGMHIMVLTCNEQDLPLHKMTCMNSAFNIK